MRKFIVFKILLVSNIVMFCPYIAVNASPANEPQDICESFKKQNDGYSTKSPFEMQLYILCEIRDILKKQSQEITQSEAEVQRAEEKKQAEEAQRIAEENKQAEEAQRIAEKNKQAEEAQRIAEENKQAEEAQRIAEKNKQAEEAQRIAEEKKQAEEAQRIAEEKKQAEEARRIAKEQAQQSECNKIIKQRFQNNNCDGTVTDKETGLTWKRCSEGQTWDEQGKTCSGEPSAIDWNQATSEQEWDEFASRNDWRVPTVEELHSLVWCSSKISNAKAFTEGCGGKDNNKNFDSPTIDPEAFPNTPETTFWTTTPYTENDAVATVVVFNYGNVDALYRMDTSAIRLVSGSIKKTRSTPTKK